MNTDDSAGESIPQARRIKHYHGHNVRGLFIIGALVLIVAQSTGAELPLSTSGAVFAAVVLAVAAGITNPEATWIHWVNGLLAFWGTLLFGTSAVDHYRAGAGFFDPTFVYIEALALLSLVSLYFTTRTIRGILQRPALR